MTRTPDDSSRPQQLPGAPKREISRLGTLPVLLVLFIGSGCSALIYEIVWLQSLQLVIGSSAVSLGVLLGTFMGGMCLGSLLLPRLVSVRRHPLRVYALIELGIGIAGLAILFGMPYVDQLYAAHVRPGLASILMRGAVCAMCLLLPTLLMGATLPAIARWVEATSQGVSWLGFFYGSNIAGAVFGCLLAGFYLLRVHDTAVATYVAAALNVAVASTALVLAGRTVHVAQPSWRGRPALASRGHLGLASPKNHDVPFAPEAQGQDALATKEQGRDALATRGATLLDQASGDACPTRARVVYLVIGLSGLTALGAEVVWTRILSLLLGGTVYTFSIILAVFLTGLGIGSSIGSVISRHSERPRLALGLCQLLLMGAIAWAAYALAESLPYWPIDPSLSKSPWLSFQLDLMRCVWAVLPGAILWGASFPLALASVVCSGPVSPRRVSVPARPSSMGVPPMNSGSRAGCPCYEEMPDGVTTNEPGRLVGGVYAANTVGAILGSLAFSMVLIPWLGTRGSQRVMIALAAVSVLLLLLATIRARSGGKGPQTQCTAFGSPGLKRSLGMADLSNMEPSPSPSGLTLPPGQRGGRWLAWMALALVPALAILLTWAIPTTPWGLAAYGRHMAVYANQLVPGIVKEQDVPSDSSREDLFCVYTREGMSVSVAVTKSTAGVRSFHGAGKVQASNDPQDMRLQRMLGHIPALVHGNPESVLVVACGAGVTAGSFVVHPSVKRIVICDIEPLVPKFVAPQFQKENYDVVNDPRTEIVYDDGRHFVSTTTEKFDIITSDPIDPWVKGCAALNTREYYTMCKKHLRPGGVMALWMPLYESNSQTAKSLIATFFQVFPDGILWSNDSSGNGYDAVLFGQVGPTRINLDELQQRLDRPEYLPVVQSLRDVEFPSVDSLLATYAGRASQLQEWMRDAQINTDRNLRLQYLAGLSLNSHESTAIFDEILHCYEFPADLFLGSTDRVAALRQALEDAGRSAHAAGPQP